MVTMNGKLESEEVCKERREKMNRWTDVSSCLNHFVFRFSQDQAVQNANRRAERGWSLLLS